MAPPKAIRYTVWTAIGYVTLRLRDQLKITCAFKTDSVLVGMCDKIIWCENFHCLALTFPAGVWNHWVVGIIAYKRHRFSVELLRAGFCTMTSLSAPLHLTVSGSFEGDAIFCFCVQHCASSKVSLTVHKQKGLVFTAYDNAKSRLDHGTVTKIQRQK